MPESSDILRLGSVGSSSRSSNESFGLFPDLSDRPTPWRREPSGFLAWNTKNPGQLVNVPVAPGSKPRCQKLQPNSKQRDTLPLAEQSQYRLGDGVCLAQHGRAGLLQDLVLGELNHFRCHVGVTNP